MTCRPYTIHSGINAHHVHPILLPPRGRILRAGLSRVHAAALAIYVVKYLARKLDIVVCKLADLSVVDAENLSLLGRAKGKTRDHIHDKEDETCANEGIGATSERVSQLVRELHPVVIEPTTLDAGNAVETGDVVCSKESGENVADKAADAVDGENVEGVVNAEDELQLGSVIGKRGTKNTIDDSGPDGDVSLTVG
jgi:hypothetical protein